ncbi:MAG: HIT family protein [Candidatus Liptonbacteria bacterium]|nr:HIT family protein [Candidatus Liptonbacteria bacterium]
MDCLFCKIAHKEIFSHVVYEDAHVFAFLDIHPKAPGHTMVIPKVHAGTLGDLPQEEVAPLFEAVQKISKEVKKRLNADALTIGVNDGRASGQAVGHLHVHVLSRFEEDGGGSIHSIVENPSKDPLEIMQKKLYITST